MVIIYNSDIIDGKYPQWLQSLLGKYFKRYFVVTVLLSYPCRFIVWPWDCLPYLKKKWRKSLLILKLVKNSMKNFEGARGSRDGKVVTVSTRLTEMSGELVFAALYAIL